MSDKPDACATCGGLLLLRAYYGPGWLDWDWEVCPECISEDAGQETGT